MLSSGRLWENKGVQGYMPESEADLVMHNFTANSRNYS